jgi:hypothetical protein
MCSNLVIELTSGIHKVADFIHLATSILTCLSFNYFLDIPFETESDLRERGASRTPDVLLTCPIGVKVGTEWKVICWIDSKVCTLFIFGWTTENKLRQNKLAHSATLFDI